MAKSIICEGKTTTEAIKKGLEQLNCKEDDVNIKIIDNGEKKAFFSILDPRVVKVELTLKENKSNNDKKNNDYRSSSRTEKRVPSENDLNEFKKGVSKFLDEFCKLFGDINYSMENKDSNIYISLSGENASKLIGYRGETINSLQNLIMVIGNKNTDTKVKAYIDIEGYREKREKALSELALKIEKTVKRTGKKVTLEPMTAFERKIIHTTLQDSKYVTTYSIGEEPRRKVVIDKK